MSNVGAGILNIITESLYDKPIVVFREYVQNSVDSFQRIEGKVDPSVLKSHIQYKDNNLIFIDNGAGIPEDDFEVKMKHIAYSKKSRITNIGYKGIGRLSGLPYCNRIIFINIISIKNRLYQRFIMDGQKYNEIKREVYESELTSEQIIEMIGTYSNEFSEQEIREIQSYIVPYQFMFTVQDTGFLVILENINSILKGTIDKEDFFAQLGWLLPVKFKEELFNQPIKKQLFKDLSERLPNSSVIPAKAYNVIYNNMPIERPIKANMLRDYICKTYFANYAVGFHSFNRDKIQVTRNDFSGIKLYIDNILLCDENELIPILQQYGLIEHSTNELVQTVKGIGALIYITDKISLSANARRTFIEVTDEDSLKFLKLLSEFINSIYDARYALSRYSNVKNSYGQEQEKLIRYRDAANAALRKLARDEITISIEDGMTKEFSDLGADEQRNIIKKKITAYMNQKIRDYLLQASEFDYETAIDDFIIWFSSNK